MINAQNNLYDTATTTISATHRYIQFNPSSLKDIYDIGESDFFYVDFPLNKEVILMGDYYQNVPDGSFPILYAVVDIEIELPEVNYTILEDLYLSNSNPALIAESFILTGNTEDLWSYALELSGIDAIDLDDDFIGMVPVMPNCGTGFHAVLILTSVQGVYPLTWEWICKANNPPNPNECSLNGDTKKPSGKFSVFDTQDNDYKGAYGIEVHFWNGWFNFENVHTNQYGCFRESDSFNNKMYMWVKFRNYQCSIRASENNQSTWQFAAPYVTYIEIFDNQDINNINCEIDFWSSQGSRNHVIYGAATVNNALREFRLHASYDGISLPPNRLNIYLNKDETSGAALMASQNIFTATNLAILTTSPLVGIPLGTPIVAYGVIMAKQVVPDLIIGISQPTSDKLKFLAFHEIAHASHYQLVGSSYWAGLILSEAAAIAVDINKPHGTATSPGAGKISICESWADYIGFDYIDRTYVNNKSLRGAYQGERRWFETTNHVPSGLHWDLADDNNEIKITGATITSKNEDFSDSAVVIDNVHGFTNQMMFNSLHQYTIDIFDYKNTLISNSLNSTTNSITDVNTLFSSYNN